MFSEVHTKLVKETKSTWRIPLIIASNWLFQGMTGMDRTEFVFRYVVETLLGCCIFAVTFEIIPTFFIAHTLNWIFFGQIPVLIKNIGYGGADKTAVKDYAYQLKYRASREKSIKKTIVIGSMARSELSNTSDLDVWLMRKSGIVNGILACKFAAKERIKAFVANFPLDIHVLDNPRKSKEKPKVI